MRFIDRLKNRKLIKENNEDYIVGLDNDEEFDRIYDIFSKKYL